MKKHRLFPFQIHVAENVPTILDVFLVWGEALLVKKWVHVVIGVGKGYGTPVLWITDLRNKLGGGEESALPKKHL